MSRAAARYATRRLIFAGFFFSVGVAVAVIAQAAIG